MAYFIRHDRKLLPETRSSGDPRWLINKQKKLIQLPNKNGPKKTYALAECPELMMCDSKAASYEQAQSAGFTVLFMTCLCIYSLLHYAETTSPPLHPAPHLPQKVTDAEFCKLICDRPHQSTALSGDHLALKWITHTLIHTWLAVKL